MYNEISVILGINTDNNIASFLEESQIKIFTKQNDGWKITKEVNTQIDLNAKPSDIRKSFDELVSELGDCRIIVGSSISGIPYNILNRSGFLIYEVKQFSHEMLDYVHGIANHDEKNEKIATKEELLPFQLVESDVVGKYFFNFKSFQSINPSISSKKALLPFLKNVAFYELEVTFSHIPPWLDEELSNINLIYDVTKLDDTEYNVKIFHKICNT